jgi:acetyl-CoA carboxylase biotin carboxyl carrier protein
MELKQIKELMAAMGRTGTKRLTLKKEGFELAIERDSNDLHQQDTTLDLSDELSAQSEIARRANIALSRATDFTSSLGGGTVASPTAQEKSDASSLFITSPMVGTFYTSPSPDDANFVKPGDKIDKNTIVCIIEAMKVMNEVKAGITGTVAEILVDSGSPVEFGTKLFRIT